MADLSHILVHLIMKFQPSITRTTPGTHLVTVTIKAIVIIVTIHCRMHLPHPRPHLRRLTHRLLLELYLLGCQLILVIIAPCQSTMAAYYHSPVSSHASQWGLVSA